MTVEMAAAAAAVSAAMVAMLGDWNRPPVSIEMKEGAKPYHGRPYPIPQTHKATLMKEINRLESIGVLKRQ